MRCTHSISNTPPRSNNSGLQGCALRRPTIGHRRSVSNGGAAVQAAEQDSAGLIDGVVAGEPSAQPSTTSGYGVQLGAAVPAYGKPLMDYFTFANLYQPCAALAGGGTLQVSIYNYMGLTVQTTKPPTVALALAAKGLVAGSSTAEQATDALNKLRAYGWTSDNDCMHNAHYALGNAVIISMMYSNAYGRFSVTDNICGMSAAAVTAGAPAAMSANAKAASFATGNGTVNGTPATVVYNDSVRRCQGLERGCRPAAGVADFAGRCSVPARALFTGVDTVTGAA